MNKQRRSFLKLAAMSFAGIPFIHLLNPKKAFAAEEIVSLENPTAKALGYYHDAEKVDVAKWAKRSTPESKTQFCSNCQFAVGEAKAVEGQEGKWIGCQLFPGKLVNEKGWCNSWFAKTS